MNMWYELKKGVHMHKPKKMHLKALKIFGMESKIICESL